jgi:signal transduction histidine kinase
LTASGWRDVEVSVTPIRDGAGQVQGALVVFADLAERRRSEETRERENTFAALGEMSITIAHEIRNPLGAVELFASLLHEELRDDPRREELTGSIIHGVHTLNAIVSNLLFFARPMTPLFQSLDLHQVLEEALGFAVHAVRQKEIALIKAFAGGDLPIQGDREQLKQVFLNLFLNAVQAMGPGGRLVVQTRRRGGAAEVSLSDTGPGIPADVLPRIFDPFFTTKPKGTGLGLAIAQRILDQHKAGIRVVTRMGKGTTFILSFFDGRRAQRSDAR